MLLIFRFAYFFLPYFKSNSHLCSFVFFPVALHWACPLSVVLENTFSTGREPHVSTPNDRNSLAGRRSGQDGPVAS